MRRILPFALLALVVGALVLGRAARQEAGIEVSAESIQTWVSSLGWQAPALYVGLVTFRIFLLLPSWVVLSAGGLVFGAFLGTVLGGLGVLMGLYAITWRRRKQYPVNRKVFDRQVRSQ